MDFELGDEQRDFAEAIRDFCSRECGKPEQRERLTNGYTEQHSKELYAKLAETGWLGVAIDERHGGSGGGMVDACVFMEETSRGLAPINGYATTLIVAKATEKFGTEEQKDEILGGIARGAVEAIAMTEPEAGSDVGSLTTSAERSNGGFVINGQKVFCSNSHLSDHVLVVCRTTKGESKHEGMTMLFVPAGAEGMEMQGDRHARRAARPTTSTSPTARCPSRAVLGEVDHGWPQLMAGLNAERLILAATMLGLGERAFDDALAYVKERKQFGKPDRLLPGAPAPPRRPRDGARGRPPDDLLGGLQGRRRPADRRSPARPRW